MGEATPAQCLKTPVKFALHYKQKGIKILVSQLLLKTTEVFSSFILWLQYYGYSVVTHFL